MRVLIVESEPDLGCLWKKHVERLNAEVRLVHGQSEAVDCLLTAKYDIIILDLVLKEGSALAVADFASYKQPESRVIFVTNTTFFSDGSIFQHSANACAFIQSDAPPEDLAAMVEYHGRQIANTG